jgi:hypothetical protein
MEFQPIPAQKIIKIKKTVKILQLHHYKNICTGILTFVRGAAALTGPPLAGLILDLTGSYSSSFALSTGKAF